MKKKSFIIIAIIVVLVILLTPIRMNLKDGGSVKYKSLVYEVTKTHQLSPEVDGVKPYIDGFEIKILGVTVYRETNDDSQQVEEDTPPNTHTLEVTENSVGEIGRETFNLPVEISEDDANTLSKIINGGTWIEGTADCKSDCVINLKGYITYYHSDCGTLNKYNLSELSTYSSKVQEVDGKSLVLSEEDRIIVNNILQKYIKLGIESNWPIPIC